MKFIFILSIIIYFSSCSFDNKSGIWISENQNIKKKNFSEFETLVSSKEVFNEIIIPKKKF